jgi:hypothetical protein
MRAFREKFGDLSGDDIGVRLAALMQEFLTHDAPKPEKSEVRSLKSEAKDAPEELKVR